MERKKFKCSLFSKDVSNLVGYKVVSMYISTKIYDREANWLHGREASWVVRMEGGLNEMSWTQTT